MNALAERYVRLVLALGQHDPDYVDAYYGPPSGGPRRSTPRCRWPRSTQPRPTWPATSQRRSRRHRREVGLPRLRHQYLARQLGGASRARVRCCPAAKLRFDEESKALYDAVAPTHTGGVPRHARDARAAAAGPGPLLERYDAFRSRFVDSARAARRHVQGGHRRLPSRTLQHITLPPGESFTVEYVTDKSWSGYNWYQGNYRSLIQVNTDLPIYVDRAIDPGVPRRLSGPSRLQRAAREEPRPRSRLGRAIRSIRCSRRSR